MHTQLLAAAFSHAIMFAGEQDERNHNYLMAQLQASTLKNMVDALITRRVDVVSKHCHDILALYERQQQAYIQQRDKYTDKMLDSDDALRRTELKSLIDETDTRLAEIRADARLLFDRMGELLLALGGRGINSAMGFARDLSGSLGLPEQYDS